VATSPYTPAQSQPRNGWGLAGFIISLVGLLLTCGLVSPLGLLISLIGLLKRPRGLAIAGTLLGLLGTAFLAFAGLAIVATFLGYRDSAANEDKKIRTNEAMTAAMRIVDDYRQKNGSLPSDDEGQKLMVDTKDGWDQTLSYTRKGENAFEIRSSGSDKDFFTEDDLASTDAKFTPIDTGDMEIETGEGTSGEGPLQIPDGAATPQPTQPEAPDSATPDKSADKVGDEDSDESKDDAKESP
jgi:hypothetical protein